MDPRQGGWRRFVPLAAAAAVGALTGGAGYWVVMMQRAHAADRIASDAQAAAVRATETVRSSGAALEAQTQNATTTPRLVAALEANVDQATVQDLLLNEPWWDQFRRTVGGYALYTEEGTALVSAGVPAAVNAEAVVREARRSRHAASRLVAAGGQVIALCAAPVTLAGRSDWPVLVAIKSIDATLLSSLAARVGAAIGISDGSQILVAAATSHEAEPGELGALQTAAALAAPGGQRVGKIMVAALPIAEGLHALVGLSAGSPGDGLALTWPAVCILVLGFACALGIYVIVARHTALRVPLAPPGPTIPTSGGAPDRVANVIGSYALVERIGQGGPSPPDASITISAARPRAPS